MSSAPDLARRYFEAIGARDLDAAMAMWAPGGVERLVGQRELAAPDEIRAFQNELNGAFPDLAWEVLEVIGSDEAETRRVVVQWRAIGTFAGPGTFQGFVANGAHLEMEGCDILAFNAEDKLERLDAYLDSGHVARQLGVLPPAGSRAESNLTKLANVRTRARAWVQGSEAERIAEGVWLVRGGIPKTMNVYLIEDDGGVTVFDAGVSGMAAAVASAAARLGAIKRVVLGHADADHRGAAPGLNAPVYCHPAEREAAESPESYRTYWDRSKLDMRGRTVLWRLIAGWDGGPVEVAGTVDEGDEIAGFRVIHLPGHAPGLIGLFRESDRLALVSDTVYTLDELTGRHAPAHVPHSAFNQDTEQARASIRKLAALDPATVWAGHADPVTGDVRAQLERAATTPA
ncbi:MAG TPA: MBL fold metallo-hydrolase [Solirubrobacteraceae bacterium]|nr:MBL fold metallo-hydrolase [Solirubrobacteraceae bacterium]